MAKALLLIGLMLVIICLWVFVLKRKIFEGFVVSFLALVAVTGTWSRIGSYFMTGMKTSLIYQMVVFLAMSALLTKTKVIDGAVMIILALLGRVRGGAGYVAVVASSFMGAFSGTGPGNVLATGSITIPAMKKSGFPAELAANVESNSSYLGNMIPPSSNIVAALGAYNAFLLATGGEEISSGTFWIVCWGCSLWFILQRLITVFAFCRYYKVQPVAKEDLPSLRETLKTGWQGLLLPVILLLPFVLDYLFKDNFFTARLGAAGAKNLSSSLLFFVAGLASLYGILVANNKKDVTPGKMARLFAEKAPSFANTIGACLVGYMIGALFTDIKVSEAFEVALASMNLGKLGFCLLIPLLTCVMGMVIPGSTLVSIFGLTFISLMAGVGCSPIVVAAMLPCFCGVMCGLTPPLGLGMLAGMNLAESDFKKTLINDLWWVAIQFVMEVIILLGFLPILGA